MSEEETILEEVQEEPMSKTQKKKVLRTLGITTKTKSKKPISSTICVVEGIDPTTNEPKLVVFRKSSLDQKKNIIDAMFKEINKVLDNKESSPNDINNAMGQKLRLEIELDQIANLLESDYITFTATWKYPSLKDLVDIDNQSFVDDGFGNIKKDEYEAIKAKFNLLLQSWNLTDIDENGEPYIVPVKEALEVDPEIQRAFIGELDDSLNTYMVVRKK